MTHPPEGFRACVRCDGTGERIECYDDLCHANDRCMHGQNTCALCRGHRYISDELTDRWLARDSFEYVTLPDADKAFRGLEVSGGE